MNKLKEFNYNVLRRWVDNFRYDVIYVWANCERRNILMRLLRWFTHSLHNTSHTYRNYLMYKQNKKFIKWIKYAEKRGLYVNVTQSYINDMLAKFGTQKFKKIFDYS